MRDEQFSRTSLATAMMRAAHQVMDGDNLILHDPIALSLLGPAARQQLEDSRSRYQNALSAALRSHVVLRSRYTEDRLRAAVDRGVRQYIQIGAGLDTFALRQPDWAKDLTIIEADHPATQAAKRRCVEAAALTLPTNLRFVSVDFEKVTLSEALRSHAVDVTQPTFFSWLGVTMYLTDVAIESTLAAIAAFPPGSEVVLTFSPPFENRTPVMSAVNTAFSRRVAHYGEPFLSFFEPAAMEEKLRHAGFSAVEFLSVDAAREIYFQNASKPA